MVRDGTPPNRECWLSDHSHLLRFCGLLTAESFLCSLDSVVHIGRFCPMQSELHDPSPSRKASRRQPFIVFQ
jgi:hypothetical protein